MDSTKNFRSVEWVSSMLGLAGMQAGHTRKPTAISVWNGKKLAELNESKSFFSLRYIGTDNAI
jgi:hypothetical protein